MRERWSRGAAGLRLMVSGSAALPATTLERWREITGHTLLERYGMTEIGMALSNPLSGERRPGHVGHPLPGVELRLVNDSGRPIVPGEPAASRSASAGRPGEIEVRGPQVFREYWRRPAETAAAFRDGWFRTGDVGCVGEDGYYRILGRRDIDIVKTGGHKVSALEVEELYRTHPAIRDLAVVGVPHPEWGEQLRAAWVPAVRGGQAEAKGPAGAPTLPDGAQLRAWGKERLAPYKVPHTFTPVADLPRNAMGKVRKPVPVRRPRRPAARRRRQQPQRRRPLIQAILDNLRTYWMVHLLLLVYTVLLAYHAWVGKPENEAALPTTSSGGARWGRSRSGCRSSRRTPAPTPSWGSRGRRTTGASPGSCWCRSW